MDREPRAIFAAHKENGQTIVSPQGDWTVESIGEIVADIRQIERHVDHGKVVIDLSGLDRIDTAGAYLLGRTIYQCATPDADWHFRGNHPVARNLIHETISRAMNCLPEVDEGRFGFVRAAERVGLGLRCIF